MENRRDPEKERTIKFGPDDFDAFFETADIDPNTLTASEWRAFENMFLEGTSWPEVVMEAVSNIAWDRENA